MPFAARVFPAYGIRALPVLLAAAVFWATTEGFSAQEGVKEPNVAGMFYPADPLELASQVDRMTESAVCSPVEGPVSALILPHAGYEYSGAVAACGYRLIKGNRYGTVIILAPSHHYGFSGASVFLGKAFRTPLGEVQIDGDFSRALLEAVPFAVSDHLVFEKEHALEVQLPFLQRVLAVSESCVPSESSFKVVAIVVGALTLEECRKLAGAIVTAAGQRKDVLIIASSDMYHGYDYEEAERVDGLTLRALEGMDARLLYDGLKQGRLQMCGGLPAVVAMAASLEMGHRKLTVLKYATSSRVTGKRQKGIWTVGYASCAIDQTKGDDVMLNSAQKKRLLEIARSSIDTYLKTGKKLELLERDQALLAEGGAFVTLHEHGELRGCIGNLVGNGPLYLTVRDMAVEAAVSDPRFMPLEKEELKDVEIEISVLSPLKKVASADEIMLGVHGVLVRKGYASGVFLPQVATETGWSKEEFLSALCAQKAGLAPDAWKDRDTELYIFSAEVFSEKEK